MSTFAETVPLMEPAVGGLGDVCNSMGEAAQISIGRQLKEIFGMPEQSKLGYLVHSDAKRADRKAKDRYTC